MVTVPLDSVSFRAGAVVSTDVVAVLDEGARKEDAKASGPGGVGLDLETFVSVQARVRRLAEPQHCWIDVHVFDEHDRLVRSETLPLRFVRSVDDGTDVYEFDGSVYRGTGASPGSVWLAPDARKVQYRLYCESGGVVYSDGLLRQHKLRPDSELTRSAAPPSRRRRAAPVPGR